MERKNYTPDLTMCYAENYKRAKLKSAYFEYYTDPYMVFSEFFGVSDIKGHLLVLKKMYRFAGRLRSINISPANLIYDRELFSNVLNAAWVINETGIRFFQVNVVEHYVGQSGGKLGSKKIQRYLTDVEVNDPYLGIKNAFKKSKLSKCHIVLNEWLKMAQCKNEFEEDYKGRRRLYRCVVKVLICCWLIYEREIISSEI